MVNYRRVVCEVAVLAALVVASQAAPAVPAADCKQTTHTHYDQRQNGTDNVRVHVDGVVIAVLPAESLAESLLSALPDLSELLEEEDFEVHKPKPPQNTPQNEVQSLPSNSAAPSKPEEKPQSTPVDEVVEPMPIKPAESSSSEPASTAQPPKSQKREHNLKQRKAQRVKNYLASFLVPLLRKNRHH